MVAEGGGGVTGTVLLVSVRWFGGCLQDEVGIVTTLLPNITHTCTANLEIVISV